MEISSLLSTIEEAENYIQSQIEKDSLESVQYLFQDIEQAQKAILSYLQSNPSDSFTPPQRIISFPEEITLQPELVSNRLLELKQWRQSLQIKKAEKKPDAAIHPTSIDKYFFGLIKTIIPMSYEDILSHLKEGFQKLDPRLQENHINYFRRFAFWGSLNPRNNDYKVLENRSAALHDHWKDFLWLYGRLKDYRSKMILLGSLNNWFSYDFSTLGLARETTYPDYFDLDLIQVSKDEVFVDLGSFIGDTVQDYIKMYGPDSYKTIYCYEITPATFQVLQNNLAAYPRIEYRMKGAGDSHGIMYITANDTDASANVLAQQGNVKVEIVPIDDDIQEPVTFIKMDIEGAEQKALLGCANHIRASHPKLALSVYHNNEDLWKIPRMVDEICPGYEFYLRYHGGNLIATETTLIALYREN